MAIQARLMLLICMVSMGLGCGSDLPRSSEITGPRVLAIRADRPEVLVGETVNLDVLVVGTDSEAVEYRWFACLLTERGRGFFSGSAQAGNSGGNGYPLDTPPTCADVHTLSPDDAIDLGTDATASLTIPDNFLSPERVSAAYGLPLGDDVPEEILLGILAIAGVNMTVSLEVKVGGDTIEAFKRVNVSVAPDTNFNPEAPVLSMRSESSSEDETLVGEPRAAGDCLVEALPLGKDTFVLKALNQPDPPPTYAVIGGTTDPAEPFRLIETEETLFYSFFSTQGSFSENIMKAGKNPDQAWTFDAAVSEPVPLWVVVRDGRGGVNWCHSELPAPAEK